MHDFKSPQELIERVEKQLESYSASGLLDSGDFYRHIKEILINLNIPAFTEKELVTKLNGNSLNRPDDLRTLWCIFNLESTKTKNSSGILSKYSYELYTDTQCNHYERDDCGSEIITEGDIVTVKTHFKETTPEQISFKKGKPIRVITKNSNILQYSNNFNNCEDACYYANNKFTFNFSDSWIMMQYYVFEKDHDGLPMIPDEPRIELAIESYLIYKFFLKLYYNNEADVQQRMQYAEIQFTKDYIQAERFVRTPTFNSMVKYARDKATRWNKFNLV